MSRRRVYSEDTLAIMNRYFEAVEAAKKYNRIPNMQEFYEKSHIAPPHFYMQRKDRNRGYFEVGWLMPLIRDCGISSTWLLTGNGPMFNL